MRVLLTGGSGFLGSRVRAELDRAGAEVLLLGRRAEGPRQWAWDFAGPLPAGLPAADVLVHLAAAVDFSPSLDYALYRANVSATARLAVRCVVHGMPLLLASTVGVHGAAEAPGPATPLAPATHYGLSKLLAEDVARATAPSSMLLRLAGLYGLDGPAHLGLNAAITGAVRQAEPPLLRGPGQARRNYLWVQDAARWIASLAGEVAAHPLAGTQVRYLAGPEDLSIREYLSAIVDTLLPGREMRREEGGDGADCLVAADPSPVPLTPFAAALREMAASAEVWP